MNAGASRRPVKESGAPDHTARYEALRAYAVDHYAPTSRDGLVVLLRQGVAAWLEAWSTVPAPSLQMAQVERQPPSPLADGVIAQVVRVLAAMVLGHIQEVCA